ncbi:ribosomal protein S18-alanine N-acetyltransferase [Pseudofrankia sp. DC12]|uniref:ribosomal protein S18-alanine N-acetyltransferase n=1 Tax=Pseudofrankia sp. DC12 TaxID=683315 RepID=UPI0006979E77
MTSGGGPDQRLPAVTLVPLRWWQLAEAADLEPDVFDVDPWTPEMFWSELAAGPSRYYLAALVAGRIVGYAGLAVTDDEAYIQTVGVHPDLRGRGLGARLMIALLREARRRGARSCGLEVRTDNHAARALYARLGFVDIGMRRGYYQPSGGDAYVMRARPIDSAGYGVQLDAAWAALDERDAAAAGPGQAHPPANAPSSDSAPAPDSTAASDGTAGAGGAAGVPASTFTEGAG